MKKKELLEKKNKPAQEIRAEIKSLGDRLWNLRNDLVSGKVKNVKEIRQIKKSIAQLMTIINGNK